MDMIQDPLSEPLSSLLKTAIQVVQTTVKFKRELNLLIATLQRVTPIIMETVKLKREQDDTELECQMFTDEIQKAEKLVDRCLKVKWDLIKMYCYSRDLKMFNSKLGNFFGLRAIHMRDYMQARVDGNDTNVKVNRIYADVKYMRGTFGLVGNHSGSQSVGREKYGWQVPRLPIGIVAFDEPLEKLKAEVFACIDIDDGESSMGCNDRSVLVMAAPAGCGKTTLVKMLCHDAKVREIFGENIFFVTVSETPNLMVMVGDLFNPNCTSPRLVFQGNEDAKTKLENFLNEKASDRMLLVLDDVWSALFIEEIFPSRIRGHQIVVTSRTSFPKYKVFRFGPLKEEDARKIFRGSAFTGGGGKLSPTINDDLVNQVVPLCKNNPLTLSVVGSSLNGKDELAWKYVLKKLSRGGSVLDIHQNVLISLKRSFEALTDELKQCFLDFGLFPEDNKIAVTALLNMWVHLYEHDDDGVDTLTMISELSARNLVDPLTTGNDAGARVNHCDQKFVTQHDLLRELAIHLNSKLPLTQRSRLFINAYARGYDFPTSMEQVQEPIQARILSISTGESFSSCWCNMELPNLEVLILNLMSRNCTLPRFLAGLHNLKILNITNHGLYPTQFNNFHFLTSSQNLSRIRLERVTISPSILSLVNLEKVSFIMCKIGTSFKKLMINTHNIWPQLVEIEIDYCQDLVEFPGELCNSVHLKKISITNCNEMWGFNEEVGNLTNLETLSLRSCTKLEKLPESIWSLKNLSVLDISNCSSLSGLPKKLGGIPTVYIKGCGGVRELPEEFCCTCTMQ